MARGLIVRLSLRWWVMPYLRTLAFFCIVLGTEPDEAEVMNFICRHGIRVTPA